MENDELKIVTENLYKQNLELAVKNKTLSLLGKLYEISILTLEPKGLASKVNSTIQTDFSFELVGVFLYDEAKDELSPLDFAKSDRFRNAQFDLYLEKVVLHNISHNAFLHKIITEKTMGYTEKLSDIWESINGEEVSEKIKSDGHAESSVLYPLVIEGKPIGLLILTINRKYEDLIEYEKESIKAFVNVIAVALDKAMLYEALNITNVKLKEANEGQKNLMHFMNHQIKGRFGNTKNIFAELLTDDYGNMPEAARPLLEKGLEEANMGVDYVQGILKGSSAENGTLPYEMKQIDFKTIVESVSAKLKETAEKKGLTFSLDVQAGNYSMIGDSLQLSEAIRNLIDNSINYTLKGSISISLSELEKTIRLQVTDTGVGITAEDMPRIFKAGGRGANSVKVNVNSTGYGLTFVKGVIEAHKGTVTPYSGGQDKGSTFTIELPKA